MDVIEILGLQEAKKLMDAICLLAYSSSENLGLRDELHILIRKQLSHPDMKYCNLFYFCVSNENKFIIYVSKILMQKIVNINF